MDTTQPHSFTAVFAAHYSRLIKQSFADLVAQDPQRDNKYIIELNGISADFTHNLMDDALIASCVELAQQCGLPLAMQNLYQGFFQENTQQRAVGHLALRQPQNYAALHEAVARVNTLQFDTVLHIGIGGSELGPKFLLQALHEFTQQPLQCVFVSGLDECEVQDALKKIDPLKTIVIMASKSFTTNEVLRNAHIVKKYITDASKWFAVTAQPQAASAWGILPQHIFQFNDSVGGRYSIWSVVSLVVILCIGVDNFIEFLSGAQAMDTHFAQAKLQHNMPFLLAALQYWYSWAMGVNSRAIVPYSYRLRLLPDYLQQLHMESLGKSISLQKTAVTAKTGGIIWGGVATNSQHSFHQLLLQGNRLLPVDFILPLQNSSGMANDALIANCLSQSNLLAYGKADELTKQICGNKAHNIIALEAVKPYQVGALLALYEHKVFCLSVLWSINPYDQWGVEHGKVLALTLENSLAGQPAFHSLANLKHYLFQRETNQNEQ